MIPERYIYPVETAPATPFFKIVNEVGAGVHLLKNSAGMVAAITNYGGRLLSLLVPDCRGKLVEVIEGLAGVNEKMSFEFDEVSYLHYINGRLGSLSARNSGADTFLFDAYQTNDTELELAYWGNGANNNSLAAAKIKMAYVLTADNRLKITCEVSPGAFDWFDKSFGVPFNLNGAGTESFSGHFLQINADSYLPVDANFVPTGKIENVNGTPFDFRKTAAIGARINDNNEQLRNGKGFNHFYLINKHSGRTPVARAKGDKTGITMELCTEAGGLQFYCSSTPRDKRGADGPRNGFSLDIRPLPAIAGSNIPEPAGFETNQTYKSVTTYRFKNQ